jgi:polyisoprenoid-binding protein YceI
MFTRLCFSVILTLLSSSVFAEWKLNPSSSLTFISVKADLIGETHHFTKLTGLVSKNGEAELAIDLSSVETNIPIRNERMMEFLFEVSKYPSAIISSQVDVAKYHALESGQRLSETIDLTLSLHGKSAALKADVAVTKLATGQLSVSSAKPVLVSAGSFDLVAGIDKLQALAGLSSISKAVPVSFDLIFDM